MKSFNLPVDLIIQTPLLQTRGKSVSKDLCKQLKDAGIDAETVNEQDPISKTKATYQKSLSMSEKNVLIRTKTRDTEINPWDLAHFSADALGEGVSYIEPDFYNEFTVGKKVDSPADKLNAKAFRSGMSDDNYDPDWKPDSNIIWHLDDNHSQLKSARDEVIDNVYNIRIGHLDTGYSKTHFVIPDSVKNNSLQHNFVNGEDSGDSQDPLSDGLLKMPGHGTGTLGILAGGMIDIATENGRFHDYLGGAYFAEVISCRIAGSVILFKTNAFAEALNYLTKLSLSGTQVHVVSMSMGGAPSKIWAEAVNAAYEAGIIIVSAAGNNFAGVPTRHVVYPARFGRVIAACGVTYDFKPYYSKKVDEMQGCYGPPKHMSNTLSAFTPNTPWASVESGTIRFSGAGTSSVTPQIASAAAIYYKKYHKELDKLLPWQRVEAVRKALYKSALKKVSDSKYDKDFINYFGNGIIQAHEALKIKVDSNPGKTPEDTVPWFPVLNTILRALPDEQQRVRLDMFNTELAQMVYNYPELRKIIDNDEVAYENVEKKKWEYFIDAVINHPSTSITLKKYLKR